MYCFAHTVIMSSRKKTKTVSTAVTSPRNYNEDDSSVASSPASVGPKRIVRKESEQRRRVMMNQYFDELVTLLSMVSDRITPRKMDKASTLQEAVRLMKQYYDLEQKSIPKSETSDYRPGFLNRGEVISFLLDAMNAFLMVVSDNGRILYSTDLITSLTGYMPTRLIGQSIYDCVHEEDHFVIKEMFRIPDNVQGIPIETTPIIGYPSRFFQCRFKIFTNDTSAVPVCRDFLCLSYLRQWKEIPVEDASPPPSPSDSPLCIPHPQSCVLIMGKFGSSLTSVDQPVTTNDVNFEFELRVSKEGKILDMDPQATLILGYTSADLVGSLFFDYIDPSHLDKVSESISHFLTKGLGISQPYRILSKSSRYLWVVSKGFLSYNPWNHKPDHVLLQCKILGCDEILTEYRFAQEKRFLPDLNGQEFYEPKPVTLPLNKHLVDTSTISTSSSSRPDTSAHVSSNFTPNRPFSVPSSSVHSLSKLPGPAPTQTAPTLAGPTPELVQGLIMSYTQQQPQLPPSSIQQPVYPITTTCAPAPQFSTNYSQHTSSIDVIRQELEQKNQELFEMQRKILAQQQQFEQERKQFLAITNQVMAYIGSHGNEGGTVSNSNPSSPWTGPVTSQSSPLNNMVNPNMPLPSRNRPQIKSPSPLPTSQTTFSLPSQQNYPSPGPYNAPPHTSYLSNVPFSTQSPGPSYSMLTTPTLHPSSLYPMMNPLGPLPQVPAGPPYVGGPNTSYHSHPPTQLLHGNYGNHGPKYDPQHPPHSQIFNVYSTTSN